MKDFEFNKEIKTEENLLKVIPAMPNLELRFKEYGGFHTKDIPQLKVWFWREKATLCCNMKNNDNKEN